MKVKDLFKLLEEADPESDLLIRIDGSIYPTDNLEEHEDYNHGSEKEIFILATDFE